MDALLNQLRNPKSGLKRRDIGKFKDCFYSFEVVSWLVTRLAMEEEVQTL